MRRPNRTYHIIDIENLAGVYHADRQALEVASNVYRRTVHLADHDLVVVGCDSSPMQRLHVGLLRPEGGASCPARGADGADRALGGRRCRLVGRSRFDRCVIGSGDHSFAPLAVAIGAAGMRVAIATRPRLCARASGAPLTTSSRSSSRVWRHENCQLAPTVGGSSKRTPTQGGRHVPLHYQHQQVPLRRNRVVPRPRPRPGRVLGSALVDRNQERSPHDDRRAGRARSPRRRRGRHRGRAQKRGCGNVARHDGPRRCGRRPPSWATPRAAPIRISSPATSR